MIRALFTLLALTLGSTVFAQSTSFRVGGGWHRESRDGASANNYSVVLGLDRVLAPESKIYGGLRGGLYRENVLSNLVETSSKPFMGAEMGMLLGEGSLTFKAQAYGDILKGDDRDPLYLGVGAEIAPRMNFADNVFLELPVGVEIFPAFDGKPLLLKAGLAAGVNF